MAVVKTRQILSMIGNISCTAMGSDGNAQRTLVTFEIAISAAQWL